MLTITLAVVAVQLASCEETSLLQVSQPVRPAQAELHLFESKSVDCEEAWRSPARFPRKELFKCTTPVVGGGLAEVAWFFPMWMSSLVAIFVILGGTWLMITWPSWQAWLALEAEAAGPKERVYQVDNLKFVLMTLVIMSHLLSRMHSPQDWWWSNGFHCWCATFHMPIYAFASGLNGKGPLTGVRAKKLIIMIVAPFLLLNYFIFPALSGGKDSVWDGHAFKSPFFRQGITWYLLALLYWRVLTGTFLWTLPTSTMIGLCYAISWMSGYWFASAESEQDSMPYHYRYIVGLREALSWLGIYATGYALPLHWLKVFQTPKAKTIGAIVLSGSILLHFGLAYRSDPHPFEEDHRYGPSGNPTPFDYGLHFRLWLAATSRSFYFTSPAAIRTVAPWEYWLAWTQRLSVQFLLTLPTGLALFTLVPSEKTWFTEYGARTLYPYLLQEFVFHRLVNFVCKTTLGMTLYQVPAGPYMMVVVAFLSVVLNVFLASRFTVAVWKYVLQPTWLSVFFKDDDKLGEPVKGN